MTFTRETTSTAITAIRSAAKRQRNSDHHQPLLPGLPDHIAQLILSLVHPSLLSAVCRSWRRLIYSPSFPPFLSIYALLLSSTKTLDSDSLQFSSFDPIASTWRPLPDPPPLHLLLRHPFFISRRFPVQSISSSGNLILLAATTHHFLPALPSPLIFNTTSQNWCFGPPLDVPRRWCAAGTSRNAIYVASGVGSHYSTDVAQCVEKWDPRNHDKIGNNCQFPSRWEMMGTLNDVKLCREAIDAIGWRGKLCMVNVRGGEGYVYEVDADTWRCMPEGMLAGWKGPAAAMDEETLYVVDDSKGVLKKYDPERDGWEEVMESERLRGAEEIVAGGGRVCVVCGGGVGIVVVDVTAASPRLWVVDTPPGFQAVGIHILPRMSQPE